MNRHLSGKPEANRDALRRTLCRALELATAGYPPGARAPLLESLVQVARQADRINAGLRAADAAERAV